MTLRVVDVALEHLSVNTFELFGEIIGTHDSPPVFSGPHIKSWSLNFTCDGDTEFMYVRYIHQPLEFSVLESHSGVTQCFTPLGYYPSVMVVAPANAGDDNPGFPEPNSVRAFLVPGDRGILLWRGTWHALTRFPVMSTGAEFALLTSVNTQRELEREKRDGTPPKLTRVVDCAEENGLTYRVVDTRNLIAGISERDGSS